MLTVDAALVAASDGHSIRPDPDSDDQRHRHRHDPGFGGFRSDLDFWHHGRRQFRPWRAVHAGRLCRCHRARRHRGFLDRAGGGQLDHRAARRADVPDDLAPALGPRSADDDPRHFWRLSGIAELRAVAVRAGRPQDPGTVHWPLHDFLSRLSMVPTGDRAAGGGDHRRALAVPQIRHLRNLDPRNDAGPRHGPGHGHPGTVGAHDSFRDRRRNGRRQWRPVRAARRGQPHNGPQLDPEGLYCRRGRRYGEPGRLDRRRDIHLAVGGLCRAVGQPGPGHHRLLCRADPDLVVPADRALRHGPEMSAQPDTAPHPPAQRVPPSPRLRGEGRGEGQRERRTLVYWTGFSVILALLVIAPLVLPEFWRRFLTEILIWGLLAMSSDILIGYTGMVSFGHSAFFGLGMYGAAAALLMFSPPNLWLALFFGLVASALIALFVAYFSTRLRDIYFAITTLIFSQIFYVIVFTWTEVTGGENGLNFRRPPLAIPGLFSVQFTSETMHWFVLAVVTASYLILRRITRSPFGMVLQSIRENEPRTRAIGYPVERYKIVAVMLSGLFAGLAGVLYAIQNEFAAPDFVYFLISGDTVIFNVMGGIGTLVGPIVGAGFFQLIRELLSRLFGDQFPYLIPLGFIFIVMIIFLPQGLLGFARRWLNR